MNLRLIVTCCGALLGLMATHSAFAQSRGDDALLEMSSAYQKGERRRIATLMPDVVGHPLEGQAAYWDLKLRLEAASADEIRATLQRYAGQYVEDRLRNDWLLLLGKQKDWANFAKEYAQFRMRDDREVRCYAVQLEMQQAGTPNWGEWRETALKNWYAQRDADEGCDGAVAALYRAGKISPEAIWRKARTGMEANRPRVVSKALAMVAPKSDDALQAIYKAPTKYLLRHGVKRGDLQQELTALALIKLATTDLEGAVEQTNRSALSKQGKSWVWAVLGKQAHYKTRIEALDHVRNSDNSHLSDDLLAWKTRILLRGRQWSAVRESIDAMSDDARKDSAWQYWKARALLASKHAEDQATAKVMLEQLASLRGFYELLAREELGRPLNVPGLQPVLTDAEKQQARQNPGLQRALYAINIGLRSEGVREWNYSTNLHNNGGMSDRELLAAADWACEQQVWDRCINTSERTKEAFDWRQRFPMPLQEIVLRRSKAIDLDPAYVYGLIRQESRFIMDARSHVGASGLMQVMPATARWTAKKIGLTNFKREDILDRETNVQIGTAYLKMVLDDMGGSMPMAAAAYNAGPGRPRVWRNGPMLEGAIWAEGIPFHETRDYVKKVLANTTLYAAIITGQPQSLKKRLGTVAPREGNAPEENKDLP